jgi:hypothetical protein
MIGVPVVTYYIAFKEDGLAKSRKYSLSLDGRGAGARNNMEILPGACRINLARAG